jgi:hypothetical protein
MTTNHSGRTTGTWRGDKWGEFATIGGCRYSRTGAPVILCENTTTQKQFCITVERWSHCRQRSEIVSADHE